MKPLEMLITKALPAIIERIEGIESRLTTLENQPGNCDDGINPSFESRVDAELLNLSDRIAECAHSSANTQYGSAIMALEKRLDELDKKVDSISAMPPEEFVTNIISRLDDLTARLQSIEHPVRVKRARKAVKPLPPDDTDPDLVATINYALGAASGDENMAVSLSGIDDTQADLVRIIKKADPKLFAEWLSNHPGNGSNVPLAYRTTHYSEV